MNLKCIPYNIVVVVISTHCSVFFFHRNCKRDRYRLRAVDKICGNYPGYGCKRPNKTYRYFETYEENAGLRHGIGRRESYARNEIDRCYRPEVATIGYRLQKSGVC